MFRRYKSEREILHELIWDILKYYGFDGYAVSLFINQNFSTLKASNPEFWDATIEYGHEDVIFDNMIGDNWLVVRLIEES